MRFTFFATVFYVLTLSFNMGFKAIAQDQNSLLENLKLNPDTSELRKVIRFCGALRSQQPDSSLRVLDEIVFYISSSPDKQIKAEYLNERGATMNNLGRYDEAILCLDQAYEMFDQLDHGRGIASSQNNKGNSLLKKGFPEEALGLFIESEKGFLKEGAIDNALSAQQAQGAVFLEMGNLDMAIQLFRKAEKTALENNRSNNLLYIRLNTGSVYYSMGILDTAALYYLKVSEEAAKEGELYLQIAALSNLATVYYDQGDAKKSLEMEIKTLALVQQMGDKGMEISILNNLALSYANQGDIQNANLMLDKALALCEETNSLRNLMAVTKTKADLLYQSGKSTDAYEWLQKYMILKDSVTQVDNGELMTQLQADHEAYKNEQKLEELRKDQLITENELELSQANEQKFQWMIGGIILALILVTGILIVYFSKNRQLRFKNEIIEENLREKEILLMEVHHRVKNNLQMIYSILNMQTADASEESANLLNENKDRIRSISIIHEKLYLNENLAETELNELFHDIAMNAARTSSEGKDLILDVNCQPVKFDLDTLISLGIIVNELVTNSLKYAFPGNVEKRIAISINKLADQSVKLVVQDNGKGFAPGFTADSSSSFGFKMIRTLCKKLKGEIVLQNQNGAHTAIVFKGYKLKP